jgi:hypothetical protein
MREGETESHCKPRSKGARACDPVAGSSYRDAAQ